MKHSTNLMTEKWIVYIACTLDGYIATKEGNISFLDKYSVPNQDYGYAQFFEEVEAIVIGRKTFDTLMSFNMPEYYAGKPCYVLTGTERPDFKNFRFFIGSAKKLYQELNQQHSGKIFLDGGAQLINSFAKEGFIDTYIISILPELLGNGIRLFQENDSLQGLLQCKLVEKFPNGLVQIKYQVVRNS